MDSDKVSLNQVIARCKKDILPSPIPPVQFQFEETLGGIAGTAHVPDFYYVNSPAFSPAARYDTTAVNLVQGHTVVSNTYAAPTYTASTAPNTVSLTAMELSVKKEIIDRMIRDMARTMDEVFRDKCKDIYSTGTSYPDDHADSLKYLMSTFKMPILKPSEVVMMDIPWEDILPVSPLEKPEGPTQLELF